MKKLFFPKSSSHEGEQRQKFPAIRDKKQSSKRQWKTVGSGDVEAKVQYAEHNTPVFEGKITEKKTISRTRSFILRSQSSQTSSTADNSDRFCEQDLTGLKDCKNIPSSCSRCDCPDCDHQFTNGDSRPTKSNEATIQICRAEVLCDQACSCLYNSTSPQSSFGSTSIPGKVLDLYIDGEHRQDMKLGISDHCPRSSKESNLFFLSDGTFKDYPMISGYQHESPRKLAKNVVERLLKIEQFCEPKKHDEMEDKLEKHLDRCISNLFLKDEESHIDLTLQRKLEEVKERVQIAQRALHHYCSGESLRNLELEICDQLQCRIAERIAAKEAVSLLQNETNSVIVKLEREKDEVNSRLQKELDRRSDEWEIKLREFQSEEHRLRDRVRELVEHNESLQREISGFCNKEKEYTDRLSCIEVHLKNIIAKMDVARSENDSLLKKLSETQDKLKVAEEVQFSMGTKYKEKEQEYMELTKVVARLQGTCNEQERTIDGLRKSLNSENLTNKLQMEQLRLTGVEQVLRRRLETYIAETNSLRSENIYLLERLKSTGKVGGSCALKLEHELVSYVQCFQNKGLSLLNECIRMCENLLGVLERKTASEGFMESHSLVQYGMKVRGFRKDLEQLTRSLGKVVSVLDERADIANSEPKLPDKSDRKVLEDDLKSELEAERLLTSILKEKVYFRENEVEQMQVELARALMSRDTLKREIQDAADSFSCVNHKMKNLELQMIKKDGTITELQGDIRSYDEKLMTTRGILSKVTQERDLMWQEVKGCCEKNMLLNHEVESLTKRLEALEEDTLLKDGQISILKDSLNDAKSFNILFETEQVNEF